MDTSDNTVIYSQGTVKNEQTKKIAAEIVLIVVFVIEIILAIIGFIQAGSCADKIICGELLIDIGVAAIVFLLGGIISIILFASYRHDKRKIWSVPGIKTEKNT